MLAILVHWLISTVILIITAYLIPGFRVKSFGAALFAAVIVGIVNAIVWPVLVFLTLPLTLLTFGLFLFVVNGIALKIAAGLTPGFQIVGLMPAILGSVVMSLVGWLIRATLG